MRSVALNRKSSSSSRKYVQASAKLIGPSAVAEHRIPWRGAAL